MENNPIILSFDVGIINLAYCLFTKENNKWKIIDWNIIDLSNRELTKCHCGLKASVTHNNKYYCKTHSKKCEALKPFEELFLENNNNVCCHLIKDRTCNKKSFYTFDNNFYCKTHSKTKYKQLQNLYKIKPFKNTAVGGLDFDETRLNLLKKLDEKKNLLMCNIVLIENQPSLTNPIMKSIST